MHYFSNLFGKELYTFHTDLLYIIRSLNILFTYILVFVILVLLLSASEVILTSLADRNITSMTHTYCCVYGIKTPDYGQ
jgi:hypothetical protein